MEPRRRCLIWLLLTGALLGCQPAAGPGSAGEPVEFEHFVNWQMLGDRQIVFRSSADGDWDIFIADGIADELRRVTADRNHNRYADPSPDGSQVVYSSNADGGDFDLFVVGIDGGGITQLTANDQEDYSPVFSPDGGMIAFERDIDYFQLFELDLVSGQLRQITDAPWHSYAPDWSPVGDQLAYFANPEGDFDIFITGLGGAPHDDPIRIVDTGAFAQFPDFDVSGQFVAFEAFEGGDWGLYVLDRRSDEVRRLTRGAGDQREPDFSPDGRQIVYSDSRSETTDIWIIDSQGRGESLLISTPGHDSQPVWVRSPPTG